MTTKNKITVTLIVVVAIISYLALRSEAKFNEKYINHFYSTYEPGSDGYCIDSIMYEHPSWSYDQAEEYLFGKH